MIRLEHLSFSYGSEKILNDFSLSVEGGRALCLIGPSGCGKTTVLRLAAGLEKPDAGTVTVPSKISCVFQEDRLIPHLNVLHNVTLFTGKEKANIAPVLLKEAGLADAMMQKPEALSGGMKRRVCIVRALLHGGDALMLDEPFNGLDSESKKKAADLILREFCEKGKPVLMISHLAEDAALLNAEIQMFKA